MKKTIFLLAAFAMTNMLTKAQQAPSCHSTTQFAAFAQEENFRAAHEEPVAYQYTGPGEMVTFKAYDGKDAHAFLIKAKKPTNNYLILFHEWWGLIDLVKKQAEQFQKDLGDINVLALDLYDGKVTTNRDEAGKLMGELDPQRAEDIIKGAIKYVGKDANIYTVGWCMGGGWSLQTCIMSGKQAKGCIMYYGMPEENVAKLKLLETDVLGIFATKDNWITPEVMKKFEENMKAANKKLEVLTFEADHAFANPSNPIYDKEATEKAYKASVDFLKARIKS